MLNETISVGTLKLKKSSCNAAHGDREISRWYCNR